MHPGSSASCPSTPAFSFLTASSYYTFNSFVWRERERERFFWSFSRDFHAQLQPSISPETDARCDSQRWQPVLPVQDRVRYEADALREQHRLCPQHVPAVYHFDAKNALIVMQYLPPPHVILRKSITQARLPSMSPTLNLLHKPIYSQQVFHLVPYACFVGCLCKLLWHVLSSLTVMTVHPLRYVLSTSAV